MRLGLNLGYWGAGGSDGVELAQEAERLGFDSVWTAEAYGSDALTPLTWVGALTSKIKLGTGILQMPARTPANTAMSAATLDMLSGGASCSASASPARRSSRAGTVSPTASRSLARASTSRSSAASWRARSRWTSRARSIRSPSPAGPASASRSS